MAHIPRKKRTTGEDPPRGEYSRNAREEKNAPRMKPGISGRRYCTTAARCRPSAPAMSRVKQATQKPMLPGLPSLTSSTARSPRIPPVTQGPWRDVSSLSIRTDLHSSNEANAAGRGHPEARRRGGDNGKTTRGSNRERRSPQGRSNGIRISSHAAHLPSAALKKPRQGRPEQPRTHPRRNPFPVFIVADAPVPCRTSVVSTEQIPRTTPPSPQRNRRYTETRSIWRRASLPFTCGAAHSGKEFLT